MSEEKTRILHCIHSLSGGGAERQLKMLAGLSHQYGMEAAIFCVNDRANDISDSSVPIYKSTKENKFNVSILSSLGNAIRDFKPDIIHAWLPAVVTIPAMLLARMHGIPTVYSYRNEMSFHRPLCIPEFLCALGFANRIVSNNPVSNSRYLYRILFNAKNGIEIKNAVSVGAEFRKLPQFRAEARPYKILFVGRITQQKNWQCLLNALPYIDPRHNWEVDICGEGEDIPRLQDLSDQLGIADKINLLGYRSDVYQMMQSADLMVFPSWYEGMPNVLLEALAIGLPCIVSNIPAHLGLLGGAACTLTFSPDSPKDLAEKINLYFARPEMGEEMAKAGWELAKNYSPEKMVQAYQDFYRGLVE